MSTDNPVNTSRKTKLTLAALAISIGMGLVGSKLILNPALYEVANQEAMHAINKNPNLSMKLVDDDSSGLAYELSILGHNAKPIDTITLKHEVYFSFIPTMFWGEFTLDETQLTDDLANENLSVDGGFLWRSSFGKVNGKGHLQFLLNGQSLTEALVVDDTELTVSPLMFEASYRGDGDFSVMTHLSKVLIQRVGESEHIDISDLTAALVMTKGKVLPYLTNVSVTIPKVKGELSGNLFAFDGGMYVGFGEEVDGETYSQSHSLMLDRIAVEMDNGSSFTNDKVVFNAELAGLDLETLTDAYAFYQDVGDVNAFTEEELLAPIDALWTASNPVLKVSKLSTDFMTASGEVSVSSFPLSELAGPFGEQILLENSRGQFDLSIVKGNLPKLFVEMGAVDILNMQPQLDVSKSGWTWNYTWGE
ncbi:hypothetical protein AB6D11_19215 [Vibrio splendidus]